MAHGGHCVARHEGQVLFVRHALPGERVRVRVTSVGPQGPVRPRRCRRGAGRQPRSPRAAVPGRPGVRRLRLAACHARGAAAAEGRRRARGDEPVRGIDLPESFAVQPVADPAGPTAADGSAEGLGWRTRGTLGVDPSGRAGFLRHRSHDVVVAGQCPQLHPRLGPLDLFGARWPAGARVGFAAPSAGRAGGLPGVRSAPRSRSRERADGRTWSVAPDGLLAGAPGRGGHPRGACAPDARSPGGRAAGGPVLRAWACSG